MSDSRKTILLKVLLIGEPYVGKTSIFRRYIKDDYEEGYKATIGADFFSKEVNLGDRDVIFQIWDTAGQERYRSIGQSFFRGTDACILVYDICDKSSFDALSEWVERFLKGVGMESGEAKNSGLIMVVLGNKHDLTDSRQVDANTANGFCNSHGFTFFETSALTGFQVLDAFEHIGRMAVEKSQERTEFPTAGVSLNIDDELNEAGDKPGAGACGC